MQISVTVINGFDPVRRKFELNPRNGNHRRRRKDQSRSHKTMKCGIMCCGDNEARLNSVVSEVALHKQHIPPAFGPDHDPELMKCLRGSELDAASGIHPWISDLMTACVFRS